MLIWGCLLLKLGFYIWDEFPFESSIYDWGVISQWYKRKEIKFNNNRNHIGTFNENKIRNKPNKW